ncbi:red chlorophyll catabolite reductase [Nocardioides sp. GY 10113]|nr:red chlorophyll catabolite reductase [Nocardioides sp. GY 10113]
MLRHMSSSTQIKTIHEFLAEAPDVDNSELWSALWGILSEAKDRITAELAVTPHASGAGLEYWKTDDGSYEGSLNPYVGDADEGVEWLVHSWIGNRKASILDMNLQVWLGPHIDVPHLVLVFGTVPQIFHFSDLVPRRDPMTDIDYLERYYESINEEWLALRGDDRFTWSVSHGTYMRAFNSPVANSYMAAERSEDIVETLRASVLSRVDTWLGWVREATPVPVEERAALRERDHLVRTYGYTKDPMNELSKKFLGAERVDELVATRAGLGQIAAMRSGGTA